MLHESATLPLTEVPVAQADSLVLIVGPEGGIADDEVAALSDAGAAVVRLGPTVLRTSTAAAVALGALGALDDAVVMSRPAVKHWDGPVAGGKLRIGEQTTRPEPRKQAENPT